MKKLFKNRLSLLLLVLLLLFSCSNKTSWKNCNILSQNSASCLTYSNPKNCLEVEFLHFDGKVQCFFNVSSFDPASSNKDVPMILSTRSKSIQSKGYLREGNQKICLDKNAKDFITEALISNQKVKIKLDEIEEEILPENFSEKYKKMLDNNSLYNKLIRSIY